MSERRVVLRERSVHRGDVLELFGVAGCEGGGNGGGEEVFFQGD
jgi:hypothetical protein